MARWYTSVVVLVLLQSLLLVSGTKYLVTLPKEPHYDSEVLATVTAVGVPPGGDFVTLAFRGAKDTSRVLNKTTLEFKTDGVATWGVVFPWKRMQELDETGVKLEIGNVDKVLKFQKDTGYIFIQTDKPIYNPRQTVRFRIIAVDEYQRLAKYPLKVDIKNPAGVIVDRMRYTAEDAFRGQTFDLPKEATQGIWEIAADFEGLDTKYSATKSVEFEVKEYVLPRFSAELKVDTDVITRNTNWVSLFVTGKYVYGRPLQGKVEIQLGTWDEFGGVQLLPHWFRGELEDGKARANFLMPNVFPTEQVFPKGKRLYVSVNVTEKGSGENDTIVDTSTFISHPYYKIDFDRADQYFKPGFPYTLKADISSMSGVSTPWVFLFVVAVFKDENGKKLDKKAFYRGADKDAKLQEQFEISEDTDRIEIMVGALDWARHVFTDYKHYPKKLKTLTNQYIHVSMEKPIKKRRDGKVRLMYTPESLASTKDTKITLQVLSKGQVVYTGYTVKNSDGLSKVSLPRYLFREVSPSMRVVAYYYATLGGRSEFVVDSLLVDTDDTCIEEVYLNQPSGMMGSAVAPKPKDKYELEVEGGENMRVGLVAVDEAVFLLNDKQTLTRKLFFQEMENHDQGKGEGDGNSFSTVLINTGLHHVIYDTEREPTASVGRAFHEIIGGRLSVLAPVETEALHKSVFPGKNREVFRRREAPPQTVRKYFPESWLFDEIKLDSEGFKVLDLTLPDSITTWNFMAVGLSEHRGVCVSKPLRQVVEKLFFADVRLPYKVRRLEEVKVKVAIYNYQSSPVSISGVVSGVDGICFTANSRRGSSQQQYGFNVSVPAKGITTQVIKLIPLKIGELTLRVDLMGSGERDVVEKTLYVVAEGRRVHKSITFVLDPEAKHIAAKKQRITVQTSPTVNNTFDLDKKEQNTTIDLALPEEVVMGTESCHIAAFGDLMGDIITHAVVQSKSLVDQPIADAEEVLGDLGPTVHALLYVNESGLADDQLAQKGRRFVSHSVVRLLKYKEGSFFRLTPKSKPATWLTATVLKTLCYAYQLTFVDRDQLINKGFSWLASKVSSTGTVEELDSRLSENSPEYSMMLSAEVLIATLECQRFELEDHLILMQDMVSFLEGGIHQIQDPMVLAKAAYALELFDPESEESNMAVNRLWSMRQRNEQGQYYWSDKKTADPDSSPFWYQLGAKASSIEATAYTLLLMLERRRHEYVDAIADWLVAQRNENGAFVGAMDSAVAIQALSRYSLMKRQQELLQIDLSCNVSTERTTGRQTHSFKFTQKNATSLESVNNVPVGQKLEVLTKGQGLGQMHVNVEYNVPVDKNANCLFNVTVEVKPSMIRWMEDMKSNPMCHSCGIGCKVQKNKEEEVKTGRVMKSPPLPPRRRSKSGVTSASRYRPKVGSTSRRRPVLVDLPPPVHNPKRRSRRASGMEDGPASSGLLGAIMEMEQASAVGGAEHMGRERRSLRNHPTASKRSICIHVCLQYQDKGNSGKTSVEVEMLTGYLPVAPDLDRIADLPGVRNVEYIAQRDVLVVQFDKIDSHKKTCFALRAYDNEEVGRPVPASVVVKEAGLPDPSCSLEYNPPLGEESLQVFCADFSNKNRGECRCYSGICSSCLPIPSLSSKMMPSDVRDLACQSEVAYEIDLTKVEDKNQWVELDAHVIHTNMTGSHNVAPGDSIKLITPSSCSCPHFVYPEGSETGDSIYLLSSDVEKLVNRKGQAVYRYLLDENSRFLRVSNSRTISTSSRDPVIPFPYLQSALLTLNKCHRM